jgi:hypothetical protein
LRQLGTAAFVRFLTDGVLTAVQLNDEPASRASKVGEAAANRMLPAKFPRSELFA